MPNIIAVLYTRAATVKTYPGEGIARPIALRITAMVNVLAAGATAKAITIRISECKEARR
jgi:hypothetical protein